MKELSIQDAIRLFIPGVIFGIFFLTSDNEKANAIIENYGIIETLLLLLVIGSTLYLLYRPLIYNPIILLFQDIFRINSHNYRTYLHEHYGLNRHEGSIIWSEIRDRYFSTRYTALGIYSSSIHLLYITGIISAAFYIRELIISEYQNAIIFVIISILFLAAAFLSDRYYEDRELIMLKSLEKWKIDEVVKKYRKK